MPRKAAPTIDLNCQVCGSKFETRDTKRGGGVGLLLTNLREMSAPIKNIPGTSSGVVPVMKMLEDAFSYANQLG